MSTMAAILRDGAAPARRAGTVFADRHALPGGNGPRTGIRPLAELREAVLVKVQIAAQPGSMVAPSQPSIAVLPFADMSPGKDNEYFSDGMAEEIISALTRIPNFK